MNKEEKTTLIYIVCIIAFFIILTVGLKIYYEKMQSPLEKCSDTCFGIRDDNRVENLQFMSDGRHKGITVLEHKLRRLESKVEEQSKEITLLKWQIKELNHLEIHLSKKGTAMKITERDYLLRGLEERLESFLR